MIGLLAFAFVHLARAAGVDAYRRVSVRPTVDDADRPARYRGRVTFDHLLLYVPVDGGAGFARAKYLVHAEAGPLAIETGWRRLEVESIEDHEVRQYRRRAQLFKAAALANAIIEDPTEPGFAGDGRVYRTTLLDAASFTQLAVAVLDRFPLATANHFPVHLHLIHEVFSTTAQSRTLARKFSLGVARVDPVSDGEREVLAQLLDLARGGCDRRLRN